MNWNTESQLEDLICQLVSWDSRTGTEGEILFPYKLKDELFKLDYFMDNPGFLEVHDAGRERNALSGRYRSGQTDRTIVLISHFDTVHITEFGSRSRFAFSPRELTQHFRETMNDFSGEVKEDIQSGDYLFGRGTMDMKMGLALHIHLLEKAIQERWPVNLLLLTVPDEEVDSAGMRTAVEKLDGLKRKHGLDISLFL